ncbi:unnamed protein product, partial [marine sediment metagenome]
RKKGYAFVEVGLDDEQMSYGKLIYTIDEGPRVRIDAVEFRGNNSIKTKAIKKAVKTKRKKYLFWPMYHSEERLTADVTKLQNIYQKKGFLDSSITARRQFNKDKSKIRVTFVINEGAAYTVEQIVVTGNEYFDEKELRSKLKLEAGQIYSSQRADSDVRRLLNLYRENGFVDAGVELNHRFISEDKVSVEFGITQGERFRIGRINITGNEQTQDKVVRHVLDEYDFQPGQWYNADIARGDGSGYLEKLIRRTAVTESA